MRARDNELCIERLFAALGGRDAEAFAQCFAAHGRYVDLALGREIVGRKALRDHAVAIGEALPDLRMNVLARFATDQAGAAHWVMEATRPADPATGWPGGHIRIEGLDLYVFADGNVLSARHAWDFRQWHPPVGRGLVSPSG